MAPNVVNVVEARQFSRSEVLTVLPTNLGKHANNPDPDIPKKHETLYTVIDNKVYDVTNFANEHPGGNVILTHIGKDASDVFACMHPAHAYETLANFYVGDLDPAEPSPSPSFSEEVRSLRGKFRELGYYDSSKLYYAYKIFSNLAIWALSVSILLRFPGSVVGVSSAGVLMGLFFQQCGWLSHDFLHHQVFVDRRWNELVALFVGAVAQGFSPSWWKNKHNSHHAVPNVHEEDPDIHTAPVLFWSDHALEFFSDLPDDQLTSLLAQYIVTRQAFLFFPILAFARLSWARQSFVYVLPNSSLNKGKPCSIIEQVALYSHWAWYAYLLWVIDSTALAVLFIVLSQASCGFFLASVFALNHNGMPIYTKSEAAKIDFFTLQVLTGRNVVGGPLTNWFCGGLNYQIEHHILPNMPRHSFPKIQPTIEALCKKHGVSYHSTTFWKGTFEYLGRLENVSRNARKLSKQI